MKLFVIMVIIGITGCGYSDNYRLYVEGQRALYEGKGQLLVKQGELEVYSQVKPQLNLPNESRWFDVLITAINVGANLYGIHVNSSTMKEAFSVIGSGFTAISGVQKGNTTTITAGGDYTGGDKNTYANQKAVSMDSHDSSVMHSVSGIFGSNNPEYTSTTNTTDSNNPSYITNTSDAVVVPPVVQVVPVTPPAVITPTVITPTVITPVTIVPPVINNAE